MTGARRPARHGDGATAVRGWVALYTLGLPRPIQDRRRQELDGELAEEWLDAVRRGQQRDLRRQRWSRLLRGIPDDLTWRAIDARRAATLYRGPTEWVPLTRWSLALVAGVAVGASGAFWLVAGPYLRGTPDPGTWPGWGPYGFMVASAGVALACLVAVGWPGRAIALMAPSVLLGLLAAPWLWGCWALGVIAVVGRQVQVEQARRDGRG